MRGYVGLFGVSGRNPSHWEAVRFVSLDSKGGNVVFAAVLAWDTHVTHVLEASAFSSRNARAARRRPSQPAAEKAVRARVAHGFPPQKAPARNPCTTSMLADPAVAATFLRSYAILHHQGHPLDKIIGASMPVSAKGSCARSISI